MKKYENENFLVRFWGGTVTIPRTNRDHTLYSSLYSLFTKSLSKFYLLISLLYNRS